MKCMTIIHEVCVETQERSRRYMRRESLFWNNLFGNIIAGLYNVVKDGEMLLPAEHKREFFALMRTDQACDPANSRVT